MKGNNYNMKNLIKSSLLAVILGVSLLGITITGKAATYSAYTASQTTNGANIFSNGVIVYKFTLQNTNNVLTSGNQIGFFDTVSTNVAFDALAYTNTVLVPTNHVIVFTNIIGATETYTNVVLVWSNSVVAAARTQKALPYLTIVPSGTNTLVYQPTYPILFAAGLTVTNGAGLTIAIDYSPAK